MTLCVILIFPSEYLLLLFKLLLSSVMNRPSRFLNLLMILTAFSLISTIARGQKVVVASMKQNIVHEGLANPLTIMAENCDCNQIQVKTDNGFLKKYDDCSYDYTPTRLGMAQILVTCKGKTQNYLLRVIAPTITYERPVAIIDKKNGGNIRKSVLEVQMGIIISGGDKDVKYKLHQFTMAVMRDNRMIWSKSNEGPVFNEDIVRFLTTLKPGDRVVFFNMECSSAKTPVMQLTPMEFNVIY